MPNGDGIGKKNDIFEISPVVRRWILRLLVPLGGHINFSSRGFSSDQLATYLGFEKWIDGMDYSKALVAREIRRQYRKDEEQGDPEVQEILRDNVQAIASMIGLKPAECRILEFAVLIHTVDLLAEAAETLGELSSIKTMRALAALLDQPEPEIADALRHKGLLFQTGLVILDPKERRLQSKLDLPSTRFAEQMVTRQTSLTDLLCDVLTPSPPAMLTLQDYEHIGEPLAILRPYLRQVFSAKRKGVNIFIYGLPGTGKSQLVRALAQDMGCNLFEISSEDEDGDPINGEKRLCAYRTAQILFSQQPAMLLFDEVEDVFNDSNFMFGRKSTAQSRKAWMNRTLEGGEVPTFWVSNTAQNMDAAFLRRFDMVFEMPIPPRRKRMQIIQEASGALLDAQGVARFADSEELSPGLMARAVSVVESIRDCLEKEEATKAIECLVNGTLKAQGHTGLRRRDLHCLPDLYDPAFVHSDVNLARLAQGLARNRSGRLCFYGPPGTGKTAYGRWLAEQLGQALHVRRVSDLISKWVGESERNLAAAFQEAERDNAVLLIDEVDSFLQDRRGAHRSWEVSLVNEMLTQMESFPGVFVASTNLMQGLDQAALRRFDLKVEFKYLCPDQAEALFSRYCKSLRLKGVQACRSWVRRLDALTPGDFAAVARRNRFQPLITAEAFWRALQNECALKEPCRARIGFL